jgi:hypothetical protein
MLALKPSKTEAVIDPRGFCDDDAALALLVQFATQLLERLHLEARVTVLECLDRIAML